MNMGRATVAKNSRKAPTKEKSLFDDDDDSNGLFASVVKSNTAAASLSSIGEKNKSLFDDDNNVFFAPPVKPTVALNIAQVVAFQSATLTQDKSIIETDISQFNSSLIVSVPVVSTATSSAPATFPIDAVSKTLETIPAVPTPDQLVLASVSSVFGDEDDTLFGVSAPSTSVAKLTITPSPIGATNFSAPGPLVIAGAALRKLVFEESGSDDDLFASRNHSSIKIAPAIIPFNIPDTSDIPVLSNDVKKTGNSSLFGDNDDDDLLFPRKPAAAVTSSAGPTVVSAKSNSSKALSFVDDDDDTLLLIGSGSRVASIRAVSPTPFVARASPLPPTSLTKQSHFGDDGDNPLAVLGGEKSFSKRKKSLFDDD